MKRAKTTPAKTSRPKTTPATTNQLPAANTFTVSQVAEILGVSQYSTRSAIRRGDIKTLPFGVLRVPRAELLRLLGDGVS